MFRVFFGLATAALAGSLTAGTAAAGEARTIRIEPRAFYGATISLESGVRVFRPLPPTTHMIINPNKTPLHLSLTEETHNINNTVNNNGSFGSVGGGSGGGFIPFHPDLGKRRAGRGGKFGGGRGRGGRLGRF